MRGNRIRTHVPAPVSTVRASAPACAAAAGKADPFRKWEQSTLGHRAYRARDSDGLVFAAHVGSLKLLGKRYEASAPVTNVTAVRRPQHNHVRSQAWTAGRQEEAPPSGANTEHLHYHADLFAGPFTLAPPIFSSHSGSTSWRFRATTCRLRTK